MALKMTPRGIVVVIFYRGQRAGDPLDGFGYFNLGSGVLVRGF